MGGSRIQTPPWGQDLSIVTVVDRAFLPGAYALFNSAVQNGFCGKFVTYHFDDLGYQPPTDSGNQFSVQRLPQRDGDFHFFIDRLSMLAQLEPGTYCYLDSDILIERPCQLLMDAIKDGLVISTEGEARFNQNDIWVREQCRLAGIDPHLPDHGYVNAGLLGFQLPRDAAFIDRLLGICHRLFPGVQRMLEHPIFPFLDQDVLNLLVRERIKIGEAVFSISPRRLELGQTSRVLWNRPFPHSRQIGLQPKDQHKLIIHGAALRRPWLESKRPGWKGTAESVGLLPLRRKMKGMLTPYERAWAYYACGDSMPINVESWAENHQFSAYRSPLWRRSFDL